MMRKKLTFPACQTIVVFACGSWILLVVPSSVMAQSLLPEANSTTESEEPAGEKISPDAGPEDDRAIERRLRDVVSNIDGLEGIRGNVEAGVVTPQGEALSTEVRKEAKTRREKCDGF